MKTVINMTWDEGNRLTQRKVAGEIDETNDRRKKVKVLNKEKDEKEERKKGMGPRKKTCKMSRHMTA